MSHQPAPCAIGALTDAQAQILNAAAERLAPVVAHGPSEIMRRLSHGVDKLEVELFDELGLSVKLPDAEMTEAQKRAAVVRAIQEQCPECGGDQ